MRKVLIIGLDGATWDLIKPWVDEGKLPTFRKLIENGVWGNLESTIPYITLPAWISLVTGKNPGKIGYVHFFMRDKNSYNFTLVKPRVDRLNPIWKLLKLGKDIKSFILKIPTIPRDEYIDVYLKGEFVFEDVPMTEVERELFERIKKEKMPPARHDSKYILWHAEQAKKELDLIKYIIENDTRYKWDLLFYVLYDLDHLCHLFWKFIDKRHPRYIPNKNIYESILNYLQVLDSKLDEITKICEKKDIIVLVVSDHGHGPLRKRINLNKWLIDNGYMKLSKPILNKNYGRCILLLQNILVNILVKQLRSLKIFYKVYQKLPNKVKEYLLKRVQPKLVVKTDMIDWKNTKAYFSGYNGININLKGREPEGIVDDKEEYKRLISEIIKKLKTLKDPETGRPVIKNVWMKYELYTGPFVENLPDIIIEYSGESEYESVLGFNEQYLINKPLFYIPDVSSAHKRNGIFIAYGPGIKKGYRVDVKIYDIAPTILHIFGLPIPNDMDGKVLMEIFEPDSEFARRKPKYVNPSYYDKKSEAEKLKKVVKSLKLQSKI